MTDKLAIPCPDIIYHNKPCLAILPISCVCFQAAVTNTLQSYPPSFSAAQTSWMGAPQSREPKLTEIWLVQNPHPLEPSTAWCSATRAWWERSSSCQDPPAWCPSLREGNCWSNCSVLRKEQQRWLESRSTPLQGRSLFSSNITHHFHPLCKTRVVASNWLLGFSLTSYIHLKLQKKTEHSQKEKEKNSTINHIPDVHSSFRHSWGTTSLFSWKNLDGHPILLW